MSCTSGPIRGRHVTIHVSTNGGFLGFYEVEVYSEHGECTVHVAGSLMLTFICGISNGYWCKNVIQFYSFFYIFWNCIFKFAFVSIISMSGFSTVSKGFTALKALSQTICEKPVMTKPLNIPQSTQDNKHLPMSHSTHVSWNLTQTLHYVILKSTKLILELDIKVFNMWLLRPIFISSVPRKQG